MGDVCAHIHAGLGLGEERGLEDPNGFMQIDYGLLTFRFPIRMCLTFLFCKEQDNEPNGK